MSSSEKFTVICCSLLALYFVGLGLYTAGFASHYWVDNNTTQSGLWQFCLKTNGSNSYQCNRIDISHSAGWEAAVIAFAIMAMIFAVAGGALYMFVPISASFQIAAGLCTLIAVAVWAGYQVGHNIITSSDIGWSYALTVTGGACLLANGIALAVLVGQQGCTMKMIMPDA